MSDADRKGGTAQHDAMDAVSQSQTASTSKLTIERERKRLTLRSANLNVWREGPTSLKGSLDSNMKKNTAFIKRIRQSLGVESKEQLIKEAATLNLDKYIEEVVQAIPEGLGKCTTPKDCFAAAEILSTFHARFATSTFAEPICAMLSAQLVMPSRTTLQAMSQEQREKEEGARVRRQKVLLRASAELALVEIIRQDKGKAKASATESASEDAVHPGQEWLYGLLRDLLVNDREHANVPILLALLKPLAYSLVGQKRSSASSGVYASKESLAQLSLEDEAHVVDPEMQGRFRKLFEAYFGTLGKRIVKEHSRLQEQDKRNHEAYIRSGEIFEDRQQNYEKMTRTFESMHEWGKMLSEFLGVPLPPFATESKSSGVGLAVNLDARVGQSDRNEDDFTSAKSVWEDEDTRRFYEDLVDLAEMIPPTLLQAGTSKSKGEESSTTEMPSANGASESTDKQAEDNVLSSPKVKSGTEASLDNQSASVSSPPLDKEVDEASLGAGPAAQLNAFLASLPELTNRSKIDTAAVDFAFLNSKYARKRLVKQLAAVPRSRSDLIPYYARLVATLSKYMPDVGEGVISLLDNDFRSLQRKRNADLVETRANNLRFLGELVKFGITPLITIFHCLKVCLDDFNGHNVENVATLLETCGRFLLRREETRERMKSSLELLRRKRAAQNLDARQLVLLDNAYYQCNPPERETAVAKERTPMERYVTHLIYDVLRRGTQEKVLKQMRKLPWNDEKVREALQNAFVRSWRIKFNNLHLLAVLLHDIQPYHSEFVVYVIDTVCEQIRSGLETNIFKDNQRRVATLKYLGELYNYRLINSDLIFDQLWSLVSFGHPQGRPLPGQVSPIDAPDDYFRIRLVCTLLDACGMCFDRGVLADRLNDYLLMFNVYLLSKEQPLPMDIDFMLSDTLEVLRPNFTLKRTFEEAASAVDAMLAARQAEADKEAAAKLKNISSPIMKQEAVDEESDSDSSSSSSSSSDVDQPRHVSKDDASTDSETSTEDESSSDSDSSDEEAVEEEDEGEDAHVRRDLRSQVDQEAEDDFARELAKMMAESNTSGQQPGTSGRTQRGLFDVGLPFIKRAQAATAAKSNAATAEAERDKEASASASELPAQHMRFSLLSKRGNRQQTHEVHVPVDAALAIHSRANEEQQLAERQQLKKLVLGMETRDQAADRAAIEASLARKGFRG